MKDCQRMTWRNDFKTKQMFSKVLERLNDQSSMRVYLYVISLFGEVKPLTPEIS